MPADRPAPSPFPGPSALDALLRNTDAVSEPTETWAAYTAAPRLAAIVRVLRLHVEAGLLIASEQDAARSVLDRAEEIARGG